VSPAEPTRPATIVTSEWGGASPADPAGRAMAVGTGAVTSGARVPGAGWASGPGNGPSGVGSATTSPRPPGALVAEWCDGPGPPPGATWASPDLGASGAAGGGGGGVLPAGNSVVAAPREDPPGRSAARSPPAGLPEGGGRGGAAGSSIGVSGGGGGGARSSSADGGWGGAAGSSAGRCPSAGRSAAVFGSPCGGGNALGSKVLPGAVIGSGAVALPGWIETSLSALCRAPVLAPPLCPISSSAAAALSASSISLSALFPASLPALELRTTHQSAMGCSAGDGTVFRPAARL
jgi:hypothetical protein